MRAQVLDNAAHTLVMGVLNVTPDSFSDGGRHAEAGAAAARGLEMVAEGADLVDVGGESTRPGAAPVGAEEELRRVIPVVRDLAAAGVLVSIDTRKAEVAAAALGAGAVAVNDISALGDPAMAGVVAGAGAGLVLLHMQGNPATMQDDPRYADVVGEVRGFLYDAARRAEEAGMPREAIAVDPGIGFGKSVQHSLALLKHTADLASCGYPLLIGVSRKSLFEKLLGLSADERLEAGIAAAVACVLRGARIVRTHDVRPTVRALRTAEALL